MKNVVGNRIKQLVSLVVLTLIILFTYGRLINTFYQQDEWHGLGLAYSGGFKSFLPGFPADFNPVDLIIVKGRILSGSIYYFFATIFPLQNTQMAVLAILLHVIAAFLVFILIRKFLRNDLVSLIGAIFFAINSVSHQAITWPVIAISVVGSSILVLIAVLFYFKFLESSKAIFLFLTGFMLYVSLWFKETALYLFLFFPLITFLFKSYKVKSYLARFWWFLLPFFLIVGYRILELRFGTPDPNLYISSTSENFFLTILIRLVLYPLTSFSQMFIPGEYFLAFAREVLRDNYQFFASAQNNILVAQSVILDLLAIVLTGLIVFFIALFLRKETTTNTKIVLFWLAYILVSFSPYVVLEKDFSYLESRYYYLPVAGAAVLLSWLLARIWQTLGKKQFLIFALPLSIAFIFWHASTVIGVIEEQIVLAGWRKEFIVQLKTLVPNLDKDKNVFYITGEKNYWADGNRIPFQQGSGYTLMVLYWPSGKIPKDFLADSYLFGIGSQGYKEIGALGFGYFWDENAMKKTVELYDLSLDSVIRLRYDHEVKRLTRIGNNK